MDISAKDYHQGVCVAWSIRKMQALAQVSPHLNTQQTKDNPKVCFLTNAKPLLVGALLREAPFWGVAPRKVEERKTQTSTAVI